MKISHGWNIRSISSKFMWGLVLAVMTGSMFVMPAMGDNDHGRKGKFEDGRHDRGRPGPLPL